MKIKDKFIFNFDEHIVFTIYFIDEENETVAYVNCDMAPRQCSFEFFKEHAIILTPLLEELL